MVVILKFLGKRIYRLFGLIIRLMLLLLEVEVMVFLVNGRLIVVSLLYLLGLVVGVVLKYILNSILLFVKVIGLVLLFIWKFIEVKLIGV